MYNPINIVYDPQIIDIDDFLKSDVDIGVLRALIVREPVGFTSEFLKTGRKNNVLFYYVSGKRTYTNLITNEEFTLNSGDILYVPQNGQYKFVITQSESIYDTDKGFAIDFDMSANNKAVTLSEAPFILTHDNDSIMYFRFNNIYENYMKSPYNSLYVKAKTLELLSELIKGLRSVRLASTEFHTILPAILYIENNPYGKITIGELAKLCCVSETTLRSLFLKYTGGISPIDYKNRLRIDKAEKMLERENITIEYAAQQTGFYDTSYFHRMYKKYKGHPPRTKA